ncbi:MAG: hypothetical protein HY319_06800 [Armatimonadetes bacterium]|nr:hypothetical protein [Armatimonadota bacterium]
MTGLLFWGLAGLLLRHVADPRARVLLGVAGAAVALWSVWSLAATPLMASRVLALHLLAAAAALRGRGEPLAFLVFIMFLASNAWQAAEYSGQDSLSGWTGVAWGGLALALLERSAVGTILWLGAGWLLLGWVELEATPGWLRPPPLAFPGWCPPVPYSPWALGAAALVCAAAATRWTSPALALAVLLAPVLASIEPEPVPGDLLSPREVADLLPDALRSPRGRLLAGRIQPVTMTVETLAEPG